MLLEKKVQWNFGHNLACCFWFVFSIIMYESSINACYYCRKKGELEKKTNELMFDDEPILSADEDTDTQPLQSNTGTLY